jgi:uncharacterized protein involved in outer membrane biogenesis
MLKKALVGLGIIIILVVIAALAAPKFIDINHYRPQIEAKLRDRLNRNVSLGPMRLSLIPLAFRVDNVRIDEDPKFGTGNRLHKYRRYSCVRGYYLCYITRCKSKPSMDRPALELIRNEQGAWNFSSPVEDKQQAQTQKPEAFTLDEAKIYDGQVAITDRQQHKPRANYDHIDAVVSDFAPGKPVSADIRAHLPGSGNQTLALQGKIGPIEHDVVARTPVDGKLKLDDVSLAGLPRFINAEALADSNAILTGNADLKNKRERSSQEQPRFTRLRPCFSKDYGPAFAQGFHGYTGFSPIPTQCLRIAIALN